MALGYSDTKYSKNDYSQVQYTDGGYLDPKYLELAYLDPNVLVNQISENEFQLTDVTTGDVSVIERETGGGLRQSSKDDESAMASPTDRSIDNDFGYGSFSLGKTGDTVMGAMARTGVASPLGMMGMTHNAVNNVNKNAAVAQARDALSLSKKDASMFGLGNLKDPKGAVAAMQIGEDTYSVAIGGVAKDALGRNTISVAEAMDLAEAAKAAGLTVRELSVDEQAIRDKVDAKDKGLGKKGLGTRAVEVAKDAVVGALTGNPTKGISSAINQAAQAVAPSVKDIAKSVVGNPEAPKQGTVTGAYGTSPMAQAARERQDQIASTGIGAKTSPSASVSTPAAGLAANELGVTTPDGFTSPMGSLGSRTTSGFGVRDAPATGKGTVGSKDHKGVDLSTPAREALADTTNKGYAGSPLSTVGAGTVTEAGYKQGLGYSVSVSHPNGYTSTIGHMAPGSISVNVGDEIAAGTPVGQMGTTGNSQAAHAHLSMKDPLGNLVDPASLIDFDQTPQVGVPTEKPGLDALASNLATNPRSLMDVSISPVSSINEQQTLGGVAPSVVDTVKTSPMAYGMMMDTQNLTAPSSLSASLANVSPASRQTAFSPAFSDVVSPNQVTSTSVSPASQVGMASLAGPDTLGANTASTPGRNSYGAYTSKDISRMSYAMAGELSPSALKGLEAQDPTAVREALGMFSTIDNRVQSYVERGVPLSQALDATLVDSQYNSLSPTNKSVTSANFSQFGNTISGVLGGVVAGTQQVPSDLMDVTHYANLNISSPAWASVPAALDTQVTVGAHTFSKPDQSFAHKGMNTVSTPADTTSTAVSTSMAETAKDTARSLGMKDAPGSLGLGAMNATDATAQATSEARDSYSMSRSLGGISTPGARMGATDDTGTQTNALGGMSSLGGGYVDTGSLNESAPAKGTEAEAGFGGVSGANSTSRGGEEGKGGKGTGGQSGSNSGSNSGSDGGSRGSGNSGNSGSSAGDKSGKSSNDRDNDARGQ